MTTRVTLMVVIGVLVSIRAGLAQSSSLYTQEFYRFARRRLNEDGLFAQVLSLGDLSPDETAGVMRTFSSVFPQCLLWKNVGDCVMLGSEKELRLSLIEIGERLHREETAFVRAGSGRGQDRREVLIRIPDPDQLLQISLGVREHARERVLPVVVAGRTGEILRD